MAIHPRESTSGPPPGEGKVSRRADNLEEAGRKPGGVRPARDKCLD